jgi:hypothetical protein
MVHQRRSSPAAATVASPGAITVTLPIAMSSVRDGRATFAGLFARELRRWADQGAADPARWLHGDVGPSPSVAFDARFAERASSTVVLVVPGLFGDCLASQSVPFGDGVQRTPELSRVEAYRHYGDVGLKAVRLVALPGRASSEFNGRLLAEELRAVAVQPGVQRVVIVSYSKGTADALHALNELQRDGTLPSSLRALVSVAGIVMGTPLADHHRRLYEALSPHLAPLECSVEQGGSLASLSRLERSAWLAAHPPPRGLKTYSLVGHAEAHNIAWPLRWPYRELLAFDARNDGQTLASDALLPGSTLLAELRADHWALALPIERHPGTWRRSMAAPVSFPREALFRALVKVAVAEGLDD